MTNHAFLVLGVMLTMFGLLCLIVGSMDDNRTVVTGGALMLAAGSYLMFGCDAVVTV